MSTLTPDATDSHNEPAAPRGPARFATTRWSMVVDAGREARAAQDGHAALSQLCRTYWFPLYAHVRRRGFTAPEAEDLTQDFFARLLARGTIATADPARGRFRSFMLTMLDRFLADAWHSERAAKRGGGQERLSLDIGGAEERFLRIADPGAPPDRAFDREWALTVLRTVLAKLETEYAAAGKAAQFSVLKPALTGPQDAQPYAELAVALGRNENAIKVAVHRLRQRYRALLEAEIAETVVSPAEGRLELQDLLRALAG